MLNDRSVTTLPEAAAYKTGELLNLKNTNPFVSDPFAVILVQFVVAWLYGLLMGWSLDTRSFFALLVTAILNAWLPRVYHLLIGRETPWSMKKDRLWQILIVALAFYGISVHARTARIR